MAPSSTGNTSDTKITPGGIAALVSLLPLFWIFGILSKFVMSPILGDIVSSILMIIGILAVAGSIQDYVDERMEEEY
jgi:prepilin signal peptidase PulO-like enzyme (type II secretory pathway)